MGKATPESHWSHTELQHPVDVKIDPYTDRHLTYYTLAEISRTEQNMYSKIQIDNNQNVTL